MAAPHPQPIAPVAPVRPPEEVAEQRAQERRIKLIIGIVIVVAILVAAGVAVGVFWLGRPETPPDLVGRIRDIFIIVVALESLLVGVALVVLLIQLATLINLLQNEVRPIIKSTSEAVNTMRGTAQFLGESVVEPVIKLNAYLASIQRVLELMGIKRK
jgi:hypothetical protein